MKICVSRHFLSVVKVCILFAAVFTISVTGFSASLADGSGPVAQSLSSTNAATSSAFSRFFKDRNPNSVIQVNSEADVFRFAAALNSRESALRSMEVQAATIIVDDGGPDDYPGQKDLSFLSVDYSMLGSGVLPVSWGWDDTAWSGANTGDACALFDTDGDGFANYAVCVTVSGNPATFQSQTIYSCGDDKSDRCTQPTTVVPNTTTANATLSYGTDPFTHTKSNPCSGSNPDCATNDTVASLNIQMSDFNASGATLINVCSYPSQQPNSDPSECVITPNSGFLKIVKVATPSDSTQFTFNANLSPTSGPSSWTITGSGSVDNIIYVPTSGLNLTEVVPTGWQLDSASCTIQSATPAPTGTKSGNSVNGITIQSGLTTVCTFNDSLSKATLIVNKVVVNDNGGTAVASQFSYKINGGSSIPFEADGSNSHTVDAGTYTVVENPAAGYATTYSNCSSVNIPPGGTATCTITNNDISPTLTLVKTVINDNGGALIANDFPRFIDGNAVSWGVAVPVNAGSHTASETTQAGYTASAWGGDCAANGTITLALGENKTCTITNNDQAATLIVIKHVINDNGGTKTAADFTLNVTGTSPSPSSFAGAESPGTNVSISPGSYNVTENAPTGYSVSYSADCTSSIALGQVKTCTVTNNDQAAQLTVIKHVINDNGGTKVAGDFTIGVTGGSPSPSSFAGSESGTSVTINAGSYAVSEAPPSGYTVSYSADCSGTISVGQSKTCTVTNNDVGAQLYVIKHVVNDNGGTATAANFTMGVTGSNPSPASFPGAESPGTLVAINAGSYNVTESGPSGYTASYSADCSGSIAIGQTKTCTVTNNDQPATLIVIKHVINDNGGTATAANFTMTVTGGSPSPGSFPGAESPGTNVTLNAGSYSVTETGPTGYAATYSADCTGSIGVGQTKTCTVTNNDVGAQLTVIKHVINDNGGTATASNFTMSVTGSSPSPGSFPGSESGTAVALSPGSYSVSETGLAGYSASFSADCTGTLALGQSKTCTVTNNDIAATLTIIKVVLNGDLGTAVPGDFSGTITGGAAFSGGNTWIGTASPGLTKTTTVIGSYSVIENAAPHYATLYSADCSGALALGDNKTCTVTNARNSETHVTKTFSGLRLTSGQSFTFDVRTGASLSSLGTVVSGPTTLTAGSDIDINMGELAPGTYQFCEVNIMPGFSSSLSTLPGAFIPGGVDNSVVCVNFTYDPGKVVPITVDNAPPGFAHTIGFWKNWSSCDGHGNQEPVLDETLASFPIATGQTTHGIYVGDLYVDTCQEAITILSKQLLGGSTTGSKSKSQASNPAVRLAAQLLAAELNIEAGAAPLCIGPVITEAQALLDAVNYNGTTTGTITTQQAARMNYLAGLLDQYNNNTLTCPIP